MGNSKSRVISYFYPDHWLKQLGMGLEKFGYKVKFNSGDNETDLIISSSELTVQGYKLSKKKKIPLIEICLDIPIWRLLTWKFKARYKKYYSRLKYADLVLSISKKTQEDLINIYGIDSKIFYPYVDTNKIDQFNCTEKRDKKKYRVIQISRFVPHKNFEQTIKAVSKLENIELVFVGRDFKKNRAESFRKIARELNVDLKVFPNASDKKLVSLLKSSDLLVSPSSFEGLGITPLEALYCKIPVLLSDITTFREIYGDKVVYHGLNDINDQARQIKNILASDKIKNKMIESTLDIIQKFSYKNSLERLNTYIKQII